MGERTRGGGLKRLTSTSQMPALKVIIGRIDILKNGCGGIFATKSLVMGVGLHKDQRFALRLLGRNRIKSWLNLVVLENPEREATHPSMMIA